MKKKCTVLFLCSFILNGCFFGGDTETIKEHIKGDVWIWTSETETKYSMILSQENPSKGGMQIVPETIFNIEYNNDFMLVFRYVNTAQEVGNRLFDKRTKNKFGNYEIKELSDSIYLTNNDSIYRLGNKYFHSRKKWDYPDSLFVDKRSIEYHIFDFRKSKYFGSQDYESFVFRDEVSYLKKKQELKIQKNLINYM